MHRFIEITENYPFSIQYKLSIFSCCRLYCPVLNVNQAGMQRIIFLNDEVSITQISLETDAKGLLKNSNSFTHIDDTGY